MELAAVVAFASVFGLGIIFSVIGAVKLKMAEVLEIDDAKVGGLISALMFSSLVVVLVIGPLMDKVGYKAIAVLGFAAGGVCLWILATARSYGLALVACLLLGIGAMCVNTAGNVLGPTVLFGGENAPAASNLLNVFFGVGAFVTPLIAAALLSRMGYTPTVSIIGAVCFVPIIIALLSKYPPAPPGFDISQSLGLIANPAVLVGGIALFCYIGLEVSMGGFVSTYAKSHDLTDERAGAVLSGFWISLMVARLAAAGALNLVEPTKHAILIPILAVGAVISISIMVTARSPGMGIFGTILTGLAFGPCFPTLVGVTFTKTAAIPLGIAGSVFGLIFAIGLAGATLLPMAIGKYSAQLSIRQSLKIAIGVAAGLIVVSAILWLAVPTTVPPPEPPPGLGIARPELPPPGPPDLGPGFEEETGPPGADEGVEGPGMPEPEGEEAAVDEPAPSGDEPEPESRMPESP